MMGIVCDAKTKPIFYDDTATNFTIEEGIVISKNKKVFDTACERLAQNTEHDLKYFHDKTRNEVAEYKRQKALRKA